MSRKKNPESFDVLRKNRDAKSKNPEVIRKRENDAAFRSLQATLRTANELTPVAPIVRDGEREAFLLREPNVGSPSEGELVVDSEANVEFDQLVEDFRQNNFEVGKFDAPLSDIIRAIGDGTRLEGVDILTQIQDPNYRFVSRDQPALSQSVSNVFSKIFALGFEAGKVASRSEVAKRASLVGAEKRSENADDFAKKMFPIVKQLQEQKKVTTVRGTIDLLNEQNIASYNGKQWHTRTYQDLKKRWRDLGLNRQPN